MLDEFVNHAVAPRMEARLEIVEGAPVGEVVRMIAHATPVDLAEIAAWCCVLWDEKRRRT